MYSLEWIFMHIFMVTNGISWFCIEYILISMCFFLACEESNLTLDNGNFAMIFRYFIFDIDNIRKYHWPLFEILVNNDHS